MKRYVYVLPLIVLFVIFAACGDNKTAAKSEPAPRANRAAAFATWYDAKAQCQPHVTSVDPTKPDTALCNMGGVSNFCFAPADNAPGCTPYEKRAAGMPAPQPPAPTAEAPAKK